jgi:hypothetical protein
MIALRWRALPYPAELTGLHLHGLQHLSGHFRTQSTTVLARFAREWGDWDKGRRLQNMAM